MHAESAVALPPGLRVLITNTNLAQRTGSELYVSELALALKDRGLVPEVYSPRLGDLAHELRQKGVVVVDDLSRLARPPDLIHGQHHIETISALLKFPGVPAVYFCHGILPWEEAPPLHPRILRYVAVSEAVREKLAVQHLIPPERLRTILNFVDTRRFRPRTPLPATPRRALVFSNNADDRNYGACIREACRRHGMSCDIVGLANGNPARNPEAILPEFDLVFGRGRCAIEALAVGCAVICCDVEGLGPLVTPENLDELRSNNFGLRVLTREITPDAVSEEIQRYDPVAAAAVSEKIRHGAGLDAAVDQVLGVYRDVIAGGRAHDRSSELSEEDAAAGYLKSLSFRAAGIPHEHFRLETARLQHELEAIKSSRTWRLRDFMLRRTPLHRIYMGLSSLLRRKGAGSGSAAAEAPPPGRRRCGTATPCVRTEGPLLACVVLSLGNPATLIDAVRSLLAQDEAVEIVVVNSGGGDPHRSLCDAGIDVRVINRTGRLYPGGARNIGILSTTAPFVAFLADDCRAEPGWARGRIARHCEGHDAVSGSVTNARHGSIWSWTSYAALHARRMPWTPESLALRYGVSYSRSLFGRFGLYREDLRSGEDTEFNARLNGSVPICWAPEVRTAHLHPAGLAALFQDQYERGARIAQAYRSMNRGHSPARVALNAFGRIGLSVRMLLSPEAEVSARQGIGASLLQVPAAAAYAAGAFRSGRLNTEVSDRARPKIHALLAFHNEMRFLPDWFENIAPHVDGIIALDDGSTDGSGEFVRNHPRVTEYLRLAPREPHVWNEPRNRRLLVEAAWKHDADWVIVVDADERVERCFRERAEEEITRANAGGYSAYTITLRELWDRPDRYRSDGVWAMKHFARFFRLRRDHEFDDRDLHGHWAPLNSMTAGAFPRGDLIVYHLRMLSETDRIARRDRYNALDPDRKFQGIGYDYLTDTSGLVLAELPPGRDYHPLPEQACPIAARTYRAHV